MFCTPIMVRDSMALRLFPFVRSSRMVKNRRMVSIDSRHSPNLDVVIHKLLFLLLHYEAQHGKLDAGKVCILIECNIETFSFYPRATQLPFSGSTGSVILITTIVQWKTSDHNLLR